MTPAARDGQQFNLKLATGFDVLHCSRRACRKTESNGKPPSLFTNLFSSLGSFDHSGTGITRNILTSLESGGCRVCETGWY